MVWGGGTRIPTMTPEEDTDARRREAERHERDRLARREYQSVEYELIGF